MDYERLQARGGNAHMDEPIRIDYEKVHVEYIESQVHFELHKLGLTTFMGKWKTDLKILKQLLPSHANVYELKNRRLKDSSEHYSTVLRALRRLERKKFVRLVSSSTEGRRSKTYACTLLGELVVALARKGLNAASRVIAESSASFRECLEIHSALEKHSALSLYYSEYLTMETIKEILRSKRGQFVTRPDLDFCVRNVEFEWAKTHVREGLNSASSRPTVLRYLRKASDISWLIHWLVPISEKHIKEESEWLQTLRDFMRETELTKVFLRDA